VDGVVVYWEPIAMGGVPVGSLCPRDGGARVGVSCFGRCGFLEFVKPVLIFCGQLTWCGARKSLISTAQSIGIAVLESLTVFDLEIVVLEELLPTGVLAIEGIGFH
jgi:hypothetical protein